MPELEPELEQEEAEPEPEREPLTESPDAGPLTEVQEESIVDLATPTLAELYFSQGQIKEAIKTYEKVLLNNPGDRASEQRFAELNASIAQEVKPLPSEEEVARVKTEKTIAVLEDWLTRIQALKHG
jgi:hypothetical protein